VPISMGHHAVPDTAAMMVRILRRNLFN